MGYFYRVKTYVILACCWLLGSLNTAFSQDKQVIIFGAVREGIKKLPGVKIEVLKEGSAIDDVVTPENANFAFNLPYNSQYQLVFSKDGYFDKKLDVNTNDIPEEEKDLGFEYKMNMVLYPQVDGVDASILEQPVGKIIFNEQMIDFDFDQKYARKIKPGLIKLQAAIEKILREQELARQQAELDDKYKGIIVFADYSFQAGEYRSAKNYYKSALQVKPTELYPKDQLTKIEELLAQRIKDKALQNEYINLISSADRRFLQQRYEVAKSDYQLALNLKPEESHPKQRITEIDAILAEQAAQLKRDQQYEEMIAEADKAFRWKEYENAKANYLASLALKPSEVYPKTKLSELREILQSIAATNSLNRKYDELIANADNFFSSDQYDQARLNYQTASNLKTGEAYPREKIAEIDKILRSQASAKALQKKYDNLISAVDQAFKERGYANAKVDYQAASGLKPSEEYPIARVAEINRIKQEMADAALREKRYKGMITRADQNFQAKNYKNAQIDYEAALEIKPGEEYPTNKLREVETILAEIAARLAEKEQQYFALISSGDSALIKRNFSLAKDQYEKAIIVKPREQYPKNQLQKIKQLQYQASTAATQKTTTAQKEPGDYTSMEEFKNELAKKYPQGITEEIIEETGRVIIRRIVVVDNRGDEYKFVKHKWGGKFYFKNGTPITALLWEQKTTKK